MSKKLKASWKNKDGNIITVEAPDFDLEKLKKKVNYYNISNNKVKYNGKHIRKSHRTT
jgi:hypothetical protein